MKKTPLLVLLTVLVAGAAAAEIHKWIDKEGHVHYGESPPSGSQAKQIELPPAPSSEEIQRTKERIETLREKNKQQRKEELLQVQKRREKPQEVLGTVITAFHIHSRAFLPNSPIHLTLLIKPLGGGALIRYRVNDHKPLWVWNITKSLVTGHQNFMISLRPGRYEILEVLARPGSLADKTIILSKSGPSFRVSVGNCLYMGRIVYTFLRLPRGSYEEAKSALKSLADYKQLEHSHFLYLKKGSLVALNKFVDKLQPIHREHDQEMLAKAHQERCLIRLAKY